MRGKLNVRLILFVLAGTAVFAMGWYFAHDFQTKRRLNDYLAQSARAEDAEKFDRAARLLRAYVLARANDIDARIHYGELLEKLARTPRAKRDALSVYEKVAADAPDRLDIRKRAAEIAVGIGMWEAAEDQLAKLPKDGRVLFLLGLCREAQKRYESEKGGEDKKGAEAYYKESYEADPKPETFVRRAAVLRHLKRNDEADRVIGDLHQKLSGLYETHLACALYLYPEIDEEKRQQLHLLTQREHLAAARKLAPNRPDVLIASARLALEEAGKLRGRPGGDDPQVLAKYWDEARGYLVYGLSESPKDAELYLTLADVETFANQRDKAIECLVKARSKVPANRANAILLPLGELYAEKLADPEAKKSELLAGISDILAALKKSGEDVAKIDFVRGLSLVRQGLWYEGSGVLEHIRPLLASRPGMAVRIDLLLALCYGRLGDIDRQLLIYRRAVSADPLDYRPRHGLADCLAALGRSDEAADEYRHITQMERSPPSSWLALARLMVYQNLTRPEKDRRWEEVAKLLKAVKTATKDEVQVPLLEAEMLFAQGNRAGARKLLEENRAAKPKEADFWCALAALIYHDGDAKAAHAVLDRAVQEVGDNVEFRIARLRITAFTTAKETMAALDKAGEGQERFAAEDRVRLLRTLAGAYWQIGQPADSAAAARPEETAAVREAAELWDQLALLRPTELQVRLQLFDAALIRNDEPGMQQALAEINRIEGGGAYGKYGEASRLIWRAVHQNDQSGLNEARNLLAVAAARRGNWSRIPLSLARIDDLQQNPEEELKHLKEAVDLGDRQISVVKRLVQYLNERERRKDAYEIVNRLYTQAPLSNDLQRLEAEVSIQQGQGFVDQAVRLAQSAVDANSKDYRERVWLAEMLSVGGHWVEADRHFAAAIDLAGDNPDPLPWTSKIMHALRQREAAANDDARKEANAKLESALDIAEKKLGGRATLALASCYELAGQKEKAAKAKEKYLEKAEEKYLAAIETDPHDVRALRAIAIYYQMQGKPGKAEPFLRQLLAADSKARTDDMAWARRNLALALGLRTDKPDYEEAIRLLDANAAIKETVGEMVDDLRTRAVVTATRPGRRQEVIAYLERAEKLKPPQPEHVFLLAKLYEAEGNWPKAKDRMIHLISLRKDNAAYLAAFANSLIRRGDYVEAEVWVSQLSDVAANQAQTLALQVEVLCRLGRARDALPLVRRYAEAKNGTPEEPAVRALVVADLFDRASAGGGGQEAVAAAERSYLRHKELSKEPEATLPLAGFYARNNSPDKALALCDEAIGKNCPLDRVLLAAVTSLSAETCNAGHFAKVEGWLNQALTKQPDSDNIRFLFAILREFQGRFADAEAEYRKILARSPKNVVALNNLAFMLARTGKSKEEALALTADATTFNLRETRAVAYIALGDLGSARKELEAVVADGGSAVAYFHLAEVLSKLKDKPRAKEALRQAQLAGLRVGQLHPLERPIYTQLVSELKP